MKQRLEDRPWFPATGYINHGAISHNWKEWRDRAAQPRQAMVNYVAMMFLLGRRSRVHPRPARAVRGEPR